MNSILFSLPKYWDKRTEVGLWNTPKNHLKKSEYSEEEK